ncbi:MULTISPECIES: extracellular solute-binding protein [Kosmotoga]|uniref:Extracellular solute-binding protein family 1 n=1 Tax=Kosmotoga olearia (strain ATCC BAA-1733 / DSM 21960 / TBF 19.5.1) TaxID=521045 RepID=C5CIF7_KOSOT|nr:MULTISPECIES: extracellular solute-binding protein [Kosmotoga]ACR78891.1 extracellular solute-binding protein family 1 [Kosmotoga olearia TBF 19.5.1]MDI3523988.1 multiple sugar transport system substrate-binding protein [Kosmotoga sp.]MDK2953625.1 multiple sugar transport system substrate-binding protein [Kosmotoga sp.]
MRKFWFALLLLVISTSLMATTLNVLMEDVPETHIIKKLLPEFEASTGIKVNFEIVQYGDMHAKLVPQLLSPNCQYDLLQVDNYWAGEFSAAGWLEPLEKYVERDGFDISVYLPSMLNMVGYYNGTLYMIPMYNYAMGLIYRKDVLEDPEIQNMYRRKYGKEIAIPRSLDEYVELCKFIQENTNLYGSAMQAQRGDPIVMEWSNYLFSSGGDYYDEKWHSIINNEKGIKATQLYIDLLKHGAPKGALSFNLDDAYRIMSQGKAFSMISYNWMVAQLNDPEKSRIAGKVALEPMPGGVGLNGGWGWAIPRNAPDKEASWKFIKWVESFKVAKQRALLGGAPTRFDIFTDEDVVKAFPYYPKIMWLVMTAKPVPEFQYSSQMIEITGRELSLAATGEKSISKALDTIAKELDKLSKLAKLWKK